MPTQLSPASHPFRRAARALGIGGASAALVLALSGCMPGIPLPGNPLENLVEDAIESTTGGQIDVGTSASIPADWPAELPVPEGKIITAMSIDGTHTITMQIADAEVAKKLVADLISRGFVEDGVADYGQLVTHVLSRDGWNVQVAWVISDDGVLLTYNSGKR
jgi:hypothetical protein